MRHKEMKICEEEVTKNPAINFTTEKWKIKPKISSVCGGGKGEEKNWKHSTFPVKLFKYLRKNKASV